MASDRIPGGAGRLIEPAVGRIGGHRRHGGLGLMRPHARLLAITRIRRHREGAGRQCAGRLDQVVGLRVAERQRESAGRNADDVAQYAVDLRCRCILVLRCWNPVDNILEQIGGSDACDLG